MPQRSLTVLSVMAVLGWIIHRRAQAVGAMAPTDKDAYSAFRRTGSVPPHYPAFNPLIYSIENCAPLVKLGQDACWQPDPNPRCRITAAHDLNLRPRMKHPRVADLGQKLWPRLMRGLCKYLLDPFTSSAALRWIRWTMIIVGWIAAYFFVAGLASVIKTH